jgi:hypothetical protein
VRQASDYDRYYGVLGLDPGGSLQEIEAGWKLRFSASHPDKVVAGSKERATSKAQEINNARDELRRYWRTYGTAPPTMTGYQPHITPVHFPEPETEPPTGSSQAAPNARSDTPNRSSPANDRKPGAARRSVLGYSALVMLSVFSLVGFAVLHESRDGVGDAESPASAVPAVSVVAHRADLADTAYPSPADELSEGSTGKSGIQKASPSRNAAPPAVAPAAQPPAAPPPMGAPEIASSGPHLGADTTAIPYSEPSAGGPVAQNSPTVVEPTTTGAPQTAPGSPQPAAAAPLAAQLPPEGPAASATSSPPASSLNRRPGEVPGMPQRTPKMVRREDQAPQNPTVGARQQQLRLAAMRACRTDVQVVCAGIQFGEGRIAQCVRQHFFQLSSGCSSALLAATAARQEGAAYAPRY